MAVQGIGILFQARDRGGRNGGKLGLMAQLNLMLMVCYSFMDGETCRRGGLNPKHG